MLDGFASISFKAFLKSGREGRPRSLAFLEAMLKACTEAGIMEPVATSWLEEEQQTALVPATDFARLDKPFQDAVRRLKTICEAFCCLLSPSYGNYASAVNTLIKYKGSSSREVLFQNLLTKTEFYQKMWSEVLTKGASTLQCAPKIQELTQALSGENPAFSTVCQAMDDLPDFRKKTRQGSTTDLEAVLEKLLRETADAAIQTTAAGHTMTSLNKIVKGLNLFADKTGILPMVSKLEKLKNKVSDRLSLEELHGLLDEYPDTAQAAKQDFLVLDRLVDALHTCQDVALEASVRDALFKALQWHWSSFFNKLKETVECVLSWRLLTSDYSD